MTVTMGKSMSGRSSDFRLPHDRMPATNTAAARRKVTEARRTASSVSRYTGTPRRLVDGRSPGCARRVGGLRGADQAPGGPSESLRHRLPTAAARGRPDLVAASVSRFLREVAAEDDILIRVDVAGVVDRLSAEEGAVAGLIASADLVVLPGGDSDLIPAILPDTPAWRAILAARARGAGGGGGGSGGRASAPNACGAASAKGPRPGSRLARRSRRSASATGSP